MPQRAKEKHDWKECRDCNELLRAGHILDKLGLMETANGTIEMICPAEGGFDMDANIDILAESAKDELDCKTPKPVAEEPGTTVKFPYFDLPTEKKTWSDIDASKLKAAVEVVCTTEDEGFMWNAIKVIYTTCEKRQGALNVLHGKNENGTVKATYNPPVFLGGTGEKTKTPSTTTHTMGPTKPGIVYDLKSTKEFVEFEGGGNMMRLLKDADGTLTANYDHHMTCPCKRCMKKAKHSQQQWFRAHHMVPGSNKRHEWITESATLRYCPTCESNPAIYTLVTHINVMDLNRHGHVKDKAKGETL